MTLVFDKHRPVVSPALAPAQPRESDQCESHQPAADTALTIGLINNMPDSALQATERQFMRLLKAAAGNNRIRLHCFSLPSVARSGLARQHVESEYRDIDELARLHVDGMIVTGAEPVAEALQHEPYWKDLAALVDWAKLNTRSTIWSCLAAHAAVKHLDGVARHRLDGKCSGVYDCTSIGYDWLTNGAPMTLRIAHSRHNSLKESELVTRGYQILTRSETAGVDIFASSIKAASFSSRATQTMTHCRCGGNTCATSRASCPASDRIIRSFRRTISTPRRNARCGRSRRGQESIAIRRWPPDCRA
jgi:homoserine O-succinyltransferase/O-acetyltransferase